MEMKIVENKKDVLEIEFYDKTLPNVLMKQLNADGVDAYVYEKHPLFPGYRLNVKASDPMKALKKALSAVEKDWKGFGKELTQKIK